MSAAAGGGPSPRRRAHTIALALAATAIAVAVTACGFHLRGSYSLPAGLMPIHVDASGARDMGRALGEALERQGAELAATREGAASSLVVLDESEDRRVLSVDDAADVDEYEIRKMVRWQLVRPVSAEDGDGEASEARTLIPPTRLQVRRDYEFDSSRVLSKDEEERTLYRDMEQALAQQILARLQAWSPEDE